jgi:protocatechuate 3,4-dioxygenase beta subunit
LLGQPGEVVVLRTYYLILTSAVVLACSLVSTAQPPNQTGSASITGRVTIAGKGIPDVVVAAATTQSFDNRLVARATTDEDGNYRLTGLPAGAFRIFPVAKSYSAPHDVSSTNRPGQSINVTDGEAVTNVDFKLVPGGVITGRVTDSEGNVVIGESVIVTKKDSQDGLMWRFSGARNRTDDRGIYRIYGLAPGSYTVSLGQATPGVTTGTGTMMGGQYLRTFYPGVLEEAKATVLEVKEGAEVSRIDFSVGIPPSGVVVSGRVVDGVTGKPVSNAQVGYSLVERGSQQMLTMNFVPTPTDSTGRFRVEGMQPGSYAAFTIGGSQHGQLNSSYSDLTSFEVAETDVTGIEIKVRPGATIHGVVTIENDADPAVLKSLQRIELYAHSENPELSAPSFGTARIRPDGSFSFSGLGPGKIRIGVQDYPAPPRALNLMRIEHNGVTQDAIDISEGDQITGVRLVFSHGAGSIRGTVKVEGGVLPEGATFWISITKPGESFVQFARYVQVDARGKFLADNIPPGTYELTARASVARSDIPGIPAVTRSITIADGVENEITITFNVRAGKQ